jgi:hypothetical protein
MDGLGVSRVNARVVRWGALALLGFFVVESGFAVLRETVLVRRLEPSWRWRSSASCSASSSRD